MMRSVLDEKLSRTNLLDPINDCYDCFVDRVAVCYSANRGIVALLISPLLKREISHA